MERMAVTAELRDDPGGEHPFRVGRLASLLAAECGCDDGKVAMIDSAARLHDVGKIGIPDALLLKARALSAIERQAMQKHTEIGAELLAQSGIPGTATAEAIARHHHERWDGTGYPDQLAGEAIPLEARIVSIAEVFDAMTHDRPYRPALSVDATLAEMYALAGAQFEPRLLYLFLRMVANLREAYPDAESLNAYLAEAGKNSSLLIARRQIHQTLLGASSVGQQSGV